MIQYYKVGGYVRDTIMGIPSKDVDFAVTAPSYQAMLSDLRVKGVKIFHEKPEFLTVRGNHPEFGSVDYVLARKDGAYSDARHPDSVEPGTIFDDLARRDFTCNAIAQSEDGTLIDPHNGANAIKEEILHCVGNTHERFTEDGLRMIRAIRFAITKGFLLDDEIHSLLTDGVFVNRELRAISLERIQQEMLKCFKFSTPETLDVLEIYRHVRNWIFSDSRLWLEPTLRQK